MTDSQNAREELLRSRDFCGELANRLGQDAERVASRIDVLLEARRLPNSPEDNSGARSRWTPFTHFRLSEASRRAPSQ